MLYGLLNRPVSFNPQTDIPPLNGKVILITGGNVGLGRETILRLSQHSPAQIYLLARSESASQSAIKETQTLVPDANIFFIPCDLASFASVQTAARQFASLSQILDVLILNAGVMALPPGTTPEGYEIQFGINHMGHALLTKLLLPTLLRTAEQPNADVRVVALSSIGHIGAPPSGILFERLKTSMNSYTTWTMVRYGQSKLANILFIKELARRYPRITAVAVHPGIVNTDLYRTTVGWPVVGRVAAWVRDWAFTEVEEGARGTLWAVGEGLDEVKSGEYYTPVGVPGQGSRLSEDMELARKLWEWTEKELEGWEL